MSWKIFKAKFKIKSPLHIGYYKMGLLQRARYYVPGKNLWAGVTAKITPMIKANPSSFDYKTIGSFLMKNVIFSYFYLTCEERGLKPEFKEGEGLKYGELSISKFEKRFITSIPSTAIEPESLSAENESLHEIEVLLPKEKEIGNPLYLSGYIFVNCLADVDFSISVKDREIKINDKNITNVLKEGIFVGGERRYGFGYIQLQKIKEKEDSKRFEVKNNRIYVKLQQEEPIESHLKVNSGISLKGEIETVSGREWGNKGSGRKEIVSKFLAWVPGSLMIEEKDLKINEFGILTAES